MKVVYNRIIPFKGFKSINLFGLLFVRKECVMFDVDYNHEAIHTVQMKEMLYVLFYLAYIVEWFYHFVKLRDSKEAYYRISFEREAYAHQSDMKYLKTRKLYNQYRKS